LEKFSNWRDNSGTRVKDKEKVSRVISKYSYELNFEDEFFVGGKNVNPEINWK
jgi:hypothetical protein